MNTTQFKLNNQAGSAASRPKHQQRTNQFEFMKDPEFAFQRPPSPAFPLPLGGKLWRWRALLPVCLGLFALPPAVAAQQSNDPPKPDQGAASVMTDRTDYDPGATAVFFGSGFVAGETITLQVLHADGVPDRGAGHVPWTVTADPLGGFETTWLVWSDDCVGAHL